MSEIIDPLSVSFEDVAGHEYVLTGVEQGTDPTDPDDYRDDAATLYFILDGLTYKATEDPQDDYRSSLRSLELVSRWVRNTFPPVLVRAEMDPQYQTYGVNNVLVFTAVENGKEVLAVGTINTDDYYPSCILRFNPENMPVNDRKVA